MFEKKNMETDGSHEMSSLILCEKKKEKKKKKKIKYVSFATISLGALTLFFNLADQNINLCKHEPSHQPLHRLQLVCFFLTTPPSASMDMSKIKDRRVYFRNSVVKGLRVETTFLV